MTEIATNHDDHDTGKSEGKKPFLSKMRHFGGIHLAGSNAPKTCFVILSGDLSREPLRIDKIYDRIGTFGGTFSDERVVEIIKREGPFDQVFVDCPLTVPPCVACQRTQCPGVVLCDDLGVASLLAMNDRIKSQKLSRRKRPVNPQSHRLWDVWYYLENPSEKPEPTYSANQAPLVTRGLTLQKRLKADSPDLRLKETNVPIVLGLMAKPLKLDTSIKVAYRSFEKGLKIRKIILERMMEKGWLAFYPEGEMYEMLLSSVETFHAFISAFVGALHNAALTQEKPSSFSADEGWVHLPAI